MTEHHLAPSPVEALKRVDTFELFFDLVFVFAFIQVTAAVVGQPDLLGLARGGIVLALLWWAWAAFAWLTNAADTGTDGVRVVLLAAMAAMLVVAVAVPTAFTDDTGFFVGAYLVVRVLHVALYAVAGQRAILGLAPGVAVAGGLLLAGALTSGWVQLGLWAGAIAVDYGYPLVRGIAGLSVHPSHWAERYEAVVILALGETVIASGLGLTAAGALTWREVGGVVAAVAVIGAMWWAYFAYEAERTQSALHRAHGGVRACLARDLYSYLHALLVGGVVVSAAGLESALHHPLDPLSDIHPVALGGGAVVFLLGLAAIRWRRGDRLRPEHVAGAGCCLALVPLAYAVPAVVSLAALAVVVAAGPVADRWRRHRAPVAGGTGGTGW